MVDSDYDTDVWVCVDCFMAISGNWEFLEEHYEREEKQEREGDIKAGLGNKEWINLEDELTFSRHPCDCCETSDSGSRYQVGVR